jgi:hypothetical protein
MSTSGKAPATCGAIFAIGLFVANGDGSAAYSASRYAVAGIAIVLFLPFLASLISVLRQAEGDRGWLTTTAAAAGVVGIALKLSSAAPEIAIHRAHVADGTQLNTALQGIADAVTAASLYPLGLLLAAVAIVAIRTAVLPRWLAVFAAVTAAALVVNAAFASAGSVPALVLFLIWTLATSVVLFRRSRVGAAQAGAANVGVAR